MLILEIDDKPITLYRYLVEQLVARLELNVKDLPAGYGSASIMS